MPTDDEVQLTDLEVIQQFSLAVRGATAPRAAVLEALRADLDWLTRSGRGRVAPEPSAVPRPAAVPPPEPAPAAEPAPRRTAAPASTGTPHRAPAAKAPAKTAGAAKPKTAGAAKPKTAGAVKPKTAAKMPAKNVSKTAAKSARGHSTRGR